MSDDLTATTVSFDTDAEEEKKVSGNIPVGDEGVPPTPVVAIVVPTTMPNSGTDAMTRLHKLERMRDHLHPDIYEQVKAEIMATV